MAAGDNVALNFARTKKANYTIDVLYHYFIYDYLKRVLISNKTSDNVLVYNTDVLVR